MNGVAWAFVVASLLIMLAGFVALRAWQATHSTVRWMRPPGSRIAHAIPKSEVASALILLQSLAYCGPWPANQVVRDDRAERCAACVRSVERLEHRHK